MVFRCRARNRPTVDPPPDPPEAVLREQTFNFDSASRRLGRLRPIGGGEEIDTPRIATGMMIAEGSWSRTSMSVKPRLRAFSLWRAGVRERQTSEAYFRRRSLHGYLTPALSQGEEYCKPISFLRFIASPPADHGVENLLRACIRGGRYRGSGPAMTTCIGCVRPREKSIVSCGFWSCAATSATSN